MPLFGPPNIGKLRARRDIPGLVKALRQDRSRVVNDAVEALGDLGDPAGVPPLIALLDESETSSDLRVEAARALGRLGDPRAIDPLIAALADDDFVVRHGAREALRQLGTAAVEPLVRLLAQGDVLERGQAAVVLGELGDARAVEPLISCLRDGDEDGSVQCSAVEALGNLRDRRAVEPLIAALDHEGAGLRRGAAGALECLTPLPAQGADALAAYERRVVEPLTNALIQASLDGQKEVAEWLETHREDYAPGDIGPLGKAYSSVLQRVNAEHDAVVNQLLHVGHSRAVAELLRTRLDDGRSDERSAAVQAIEELGVPGAVQLLVAALEDEDEHVRDSAVRALERVGGAEAVAALAEYRATL